MVGSACAVDYTAGAGSLAPSELVFRSSDLSSMNVYNRDDTTSKLGSLNNLIINAHTGQVLYGVLNTGFGGKLIPVPWTVLQVQKDAQSHKSQLTLNKASDQLKNAPSIERNNALDMADTKWLRSVDTFFGVRTAARPLEGQSRPGQLTTNEMIFRFSDLRGMNVCNRSDETMKLGNISDLIVDAHTGQVLYGIVDTGIGGKLVPGPWNAFLLRQEANSPKSWLTLNKNSDELKNASTVDKEDMANFTDAKWIQTVDNFFGVHTVARPLETNR